MDDPVEALARQRLVSASAEIEAAISARSGGIAAILILRRLRDRAATSLAGLVSCNVFIAQGRAECVTLQNEVKRYDEWVAWMREIVGEGRAADAEFTARERDELYELLIGSGKEDAYKEAVALGLVDDKRVDNGDQPD